MVRGCRGFFVLLLAVYLGLISVYSLFVSGDVGQAQVQATTYTTITSITSTRATVETQTITIISIVAVTIVTLATVISRFVWKAYRRAPSFQPPLPGAGEASPDRLFYEVEADEDLSKLPSPEDKRFPGEEDGVQQDPESLKKRGPADRGVADSMRGGGGPEGGREVREPGGGPSDSWSKGSREVSDVPRGSTGPSGGETDASSSGGRDVKVDGGAGPDKIQKSGQIPEPPPTGDKSLKTPTPPPVIPPPMIPEPPKEAVDKSRDTTGDKIPHQQPPPPPVILPPITPPLPEDWTEFVLDPWGGGGWIEREKYMVCANAHCPKRYIPRSELEDAFVRKGETGLWAFYKYVFSKTLVMLFYGRRTVCPYCGKGQRWTEPRAWTTSPPPPPWEIDEEGYRRYYESKRK